VRSDNEYAKEEEQDEVGVGGGAEGKESSG
jgi:hypothetical protein